MSRAVRKVRAAGTVATGLRVEMTATLVAGTPVAILCEWDPAAPSSLSHRELDRYRLVRERLLRKIARAGGGVALVVEF